MKISPEKSNLNLTKIILTHPKQFVSVQNNLNGPKSCWTYRRTRHKRNLLTGIFQNWLILAFWDTGSAVKVKQPQIPWILPGPIYLWPLKQIGEMLAQKWTFGPMVWYSWKSLQIYQCMTEQGMLVFWF